MARVKRGTKGVSQRKKVLALATGYRGARGRLYRPASDAVVRALNYAYRDRRQRKRQFRSLWIVRIHAAAEQQGLSYSLFMHGLKRAGIGLDRKVLAQIAVDDPGAFAHLATLARESHPPL